MWSIIIGNGFTIDGSNHAGLPYNSSYPWNYKLKNPYNQSENLLEVFPRLKKYLKNIENLDNKTIYDALEQIVQPSKNKSFYEQGQPANRNDYIHLEACHYLRIAYAWYSQRIKKEKLKSWIWTKWLKHNADDIHTIMSYNYDTLLENVLDIANLGIVHAASRQNSIFKNGLNSTEPIVYVKEKTIYKKIIHIAKPHGSSNFTGWGVFLTEKNGKKQNLYPMKGFTVRDSTQIKVLEKNILKATHTADMILPGEWSQWNKSETVKMDWVEHQKRIFIEDSQKSTKLLLIGFGFGEPDQEEFMEMINQINNFDEIYIVDPIPSRELIKYLTTKFTCKINLVNPISDKNDILNIIL